MTLREKILNVPTFGPLRHKLFRGLWLAALTSNIGTWMQDVGQSWLMTSLTTSPLMIALLQTAASLPIFFLGIPAGALADIVDKRKLILLTQIWMLASACLLAVMAFASLLTPETLLLLAFVLGIGSALNSPAWQANVPELVPAQDLQNAISLNSLSYNMARVVGPAIGGLVVAAAGPSAVFALNALSFVGVVGVVYRWEKKSKVQTLPAERVIGAVKAGLRYARYSSELKAILARSGVFMICASSLWALLPVLARHELQYSARGYGGLVGCLGLGAVCGALLLPKLRKKYLPDRILFALVVLIALSIAMMGFSRNMIAVSLAFFGSGISWIGINSTFISATQTSVASWVRARALSIYLIVFQGCLALGGILWGNIAKYFGMPVAYYLAAAGLVVGTLAIFRFRLPRVSPDDFVQSVEWPAPDTLSENYHDRGPVMVSIEYFVAPADVKQFKRKMGRIEKIRRRDGAFSWGLFSDVEHADRFFEIFFVESWIEHLRQHERVTQSDRNLMDDIKSHHVGRSPPVVTHWLGEELDQRK